MYIAVDFDGTLVENAFPSIGKEVPLSVETVKYLISKGHKIILHTCRTHNIHDEHDCLKEAEQWCIERGIELYAVNDNPESRLKWGEQGNKVYADIYIDDHSFGITLVNGHVEWGSILRHFKALHGDLEDADEIQYFLLPFREITNRSHIITSHMTNLIHAGCVHGDMKFCYCVSDGDNCTYYDTIGDAEKQFLKVIMSPCRNGDSALYLAYKKDSNEHDVFESECAIYWMDGDEQMQGH